MTLNNIRNALNELYHKLAKKVTLFIKIINNPDIKKYVGAKIQTVCDLVARMIKVVSDYINSDEVKNTVNALRHFIVDSINTIQTAKIQFIKDQRFQHYSHFLKLKVSLLFEWMVKKTDQLLIRQNLDEIVSLFKRCIATIRHALIEHKKSAAAVAALFLVFLIWPDKPEPVPLTQPIQTNPPIKTTLVTPKKISIEEKPLIINIIAPNFIKFAAGPPRKAAFFDYFLPLIEKKNASIIRSRQALINWDKKNPDLGDDEKRQVRSLAAYYRINNFDIANTNDWNELLIRVNAIPASLALAQAANESGWGTSRFARDANNYFGQWCFQKGCGLVPTKRDENKAHEVAAFKSPEESVERYMHNLNSHNAYKTLRKIRNQLGVENRLITGLELSEGLIHYSERGDEYIQELKSMMRFNKLTRFD